METLSAETLLGDPFFAGVRNEGLSKMTSQLNTSLIETSLLDLSSINLSPNEIQLSQKNALIPHKMQEKVYAYFTKLAECENSKLEFYRKFVEVDQDLINCLLRNKPKILKVYSESVVSATELQLHVIGRLGVNR